MAVTWSTSIHDVCQRFNLRPDTRSEEFKRQYCCYCYESRGNGVLGQLKPGFISEEFGKHFRSSLTEGLGLPQAGSRTFMSLPAQSVSRPLLSLAGIDRVTETVDLGADAAAQELESGDASQRDERCGNCVFGKFKTGFITQESLNHFVAPSLVFD
jgi:hypothetical protein